MYHLLLQVVFSYILKLTTDRSTDTVLFLYLNLTEGEFMTITFQELVETYQELQYTNNKNLPQAIVQRFKQQVFRALINHTGRPTGFHERYGFNFDYIIEKHPEGLDHFFNALHQEALKEPCLQLEIHRDPDPSIGVVEHTNYDVKLADVYIILYYKPKL